MVCDKKINIPLRKSIITCASVFLVNIVHKCIGLYLRGIPHFKKRPAFLSGGYDFKWNKYNKIRTKEALEIISKESSLLPNFKNYQWDEKKETEEKIIELEDKIVLTETKIELLENESN